MNPLHAKYKILSILLNKKCCCFRNVALAVFQGVHVDNTSDTSKRKVDAVMIKAHSHTSGMTVKDAIFMLINQKLDVLMTASVVTYSASAR